MAERIRRVAIDRRRRENRPDRPPAKRIDTHRHHEPRSALIDLRRGKGLKAMDLAPMLGVTRVHMTSIERGRRDPSVALVLRWMEVLPGATLDMFEPIPAIDQSVRLIAWLKQIKPEVFEAA